MSAGNKEPEFDAFKVDELEESVAAETAVNPMLAGAIEDAHALQALLDELVRLRKGAGLTQTDVARLMGVRQPTVSQFETESSDPRLSTLQRYARAVGSQITWNVASWGSAFASSPEYAVRSAEPVTGKREVSVSRKSLPYDWAAQNARSNFTLAA
jgi:transcriptional regulator with XRE-family HTH domain